jgi:hypothetical protein
MFRWFIPTAVAVVCGLLVLLGYLLPVPVLGSIRVDLVRWATVLGAFALLLAYGNVLRVHLPRIFQKQSRHRTASSLLIGSAIVSLLLVLTQGPEGPLVQIIVKSVLIPGESALLALTAVTLVLSGMRLLRTRRHIKSALFIAVTALYLFTAVPIAFPRVLEVILQFVDAAATGGVRGLLLGVVLGVVMTGVRIILGIDRPHSGG